MRNPLLLRSNPPRMKDSLLTQIKRAFKWHWNLLVLGAGLAFGLLSGHPSIIWPVVAAGELLFLGTLGMNPHFQKVLAAGQWTLPAPTAQREQAERFRQLLTFLDARDEDRFRELRDRCAALLELRRQMDTDGTDDQQGTAFRGESLDQMLWLYLKLLHQKTGLARFLTSFSKEEIKAELVTSETQLAQSQGQDSEGRLTQSIQERIKTIRERIANHEKAQSSLSLAEAEIEKTEQQIIHLCEVGMTTRDSAGLSNRIDIISQGLRMSERTFSAPGLDSLISDETAPAILSGSLDRPSQFVARRVAE